MSGMADLDVAVRAESEPRNGHRAGLAPRRRRPVPGGRAVLGGLLVASAMVGLFYASTRAESGPTQSYVVARHALAPGARLAAGDLARLPLDLPRSVAARAFTEAGALVGATVIAPLGQGELIQASAVVAKPSGPASREVTFAVPRSTLSGSLEQGERIDVVATYGGGDDAFSTVVLRQALVVAFDRGSDRVGEVQDTAVTVAIDEPADAVALAHALQLAKLTVVRSTGSAPLSGTAPTFRQPAVAARP